MDWVILAVCFTVFLFLDEQGDRILAKKSTWFNSDWWRGNHWANRSPIVKNVLSFILDGWHFCKFFKMSTIWFLVSYLFTDSLLFGFGGMVNLQLLYGLIFNYLHSRK